ncbi:MAG: TMEM14 family protein [Verrucomicrobiota bacterium]|nr:TMEM14 family protein [Verrucomicrobiota bacterium]
MHRILATLLFFYGSLVLVFGLLGYWRTGSHMSLWSGLFFGLLLLISSPLFIYKQKTGRLLALGTSLALTLIFSIRYAATGKAIPAFFAILSALMLLIFLLHSLIANKKER